MAEHGTSFARIDIRLLGPFDVRLGEDSLPPLRSRKGQYLLALLALRQSREVQREWLADNLWSESERENAYYNLRRTLVELRAVLGPARDCLLSPTPHSLCLALDDRITVDVAAFDALIRKGDRESLEEAVKLYRGPLLEGWAEEWVLVEREPRQQACLKALDTLAALAAQEQRWIEAARWLKRWVVWEPFQEDAQRRLMQALAENGDFAAAAMAYREYREWLLREMNADPAPETTALFRQIQESARRNELVTASQAVLKETEEFVGSLPRALTSFIGRGTELESLRALLASSRLVTILGPGGMGKTRLAIRVAEQTVPEYPDGVWFVDMAPLTDPAMLPQAIARALGVREQPGQALGETLQESLQSKRLLLILDNCEHLAAAAAEIAALLLPVCPELHLLATSRQPLGLPEEVIHQVPPMTLPEPRRLPKAGEGLALVLPQYESARLFVERATEAMPLFTLNERNAAAALRILRRLEGLPLAIELAAARIRMLSVEQVAARLDNRFRLLTRGSPAAPSRQQTLRAAMDWSYDLLSEPEKALLRGLSIFAGGWTLAAAEAVCLDEGRGEKGEGRRGDARGVETRDVLDLLTDLVEKSLIIADIEVAGERRYRMLETIREYGREKLTESEEREGVCARHQEWFFRLALMAEPHLHGAQQSEWLERLEADHDNLRAALERCLQTKRADQEGGIDPEPGLQMATALGWFWHVRGHFTEGRARLQEALNQPGGEARATLRAKALNAVGLLAWNQNDYPAAQAFHEESLSIRREAGDTLGIATSLNSLGLVAWSRGDYAAARPLLAEGLRLDKEMGGTTLRPRILNNLGLVAWKQGDYEAARPLLEECLAIQREGGDHWGVASTLNNLGGVAFDSGDSEGAFAFFQECLAIRRRLDDPWGLACALDNLGIAVLHQGDLDAARRLFEEGLAIRRELGSKQYIAVSLENVGGIAMRDGDYETARVLFTESLTLFQEVGYFQGNAEILEAFGSLEAVQGQAALAARLWGQAEALRDALGIPIPLPLRAERDRYAALARSEVGTEAFEAAWAEGRLQALEDVLADVLESSRR